VKDLLASGAVLDLALAVIALEFVVLAVFTRRRASSLHVTDLVGQLLAGTCLLLGMRSILKGGDYRVTLALLTASFPAHVFDVTRHLRRARGADNGR
jgi:hypothetical protein